MKRYAGSGRERIHHHLTQAWRYVLAKRAARWLTHAAGAWFGRASQKSKRRYREALGTLRDRLWYEAFEPRLLLSTYTRPDASTLCISGPSTAAGFCLRNNINGTIDVFESDGGINGRLAYSVNVADISCIQFQTGSQEQVLGVVDGNLYDFQGTLAIQNGSSLRLISDFGMGSTNNGGINVENGTLTVDAELLVTGGSIICLGTAGQIVVDNGSLGEPGMIDACRIQAEEGGTLVVGPDAQPGYLSVTGHLIIENQSASLGDIEGGDLTIYGNASIGTLWGRGGRIDAIDSQLYINNLNILKYNEWTCYENGAVFNTIENHGVLNIACDAEVDGDFIIDDGATLNVLDNCMLFTEYFSNLNNYGTININGCISGCSTDSLFNNYGVLNLEGGQFDVCGSFFSTSPLFIHDGSGAAFESQWVNLPGVTVEEGGYFGLWHNVTGTIGLVDNYGNMDLGASGVAVHNHSSGFLNFVGDLDSVYIENEGWLEKGTFFDPISITHSFITSNGGTLYVEPGGTIFIGDGTTFRLPENLEFNGSCVVVGDGGRLELDASTSEGMTITAGTLQVEAGGHVWINGTLLGSSMAVVNAGIIQVDSGTAATGAISGGGVLRVASVATLVSPSISQGEVMVVGGTMQEEYRVFKSSGTTCVAVNGRPAIALQSGRLSIQTGGGGDRLILDGSGGSPLPNGGLFWDGMRVSTVPALTLHLPAGPLVEGQAAALSVTATGLSGTLHYGWEIFKGDVCVAVGDGSTLMFAPEDDGTYNVRMKVWQENGLGSSGATVLTVGNARPTGVFRGPVRVMVGEAATFGFSDIQDAAGDRAAGFTFAFDYDGDGVFTPPTTTPSQQTTFASAGIYHVVGRIYDKDNGYTDYAINVVVDPAAAPPTPQIVSTAAAGNCITLRWDIGAVEATSFLVEWSTEASFGAIAGAAEVAGNARTFSTSRVACPTSGAVYYARVKAIRTLQGLEGSAPVVLASEWSGAVEQEVVVQALQTADRGASTVQNSAFESIVANFKELDGISSVDDFTATIEWNGSGIEEAATIVAVPQGNSSEGEHFALGYVIIARHTFNEVGTATGLVQLHRRTDDTNIPVTTETVFNVSVEVLGLSEPVTVTPQEAFVSRGTHTYVTLGTLHISPGLNGTVQVTIDWGDGTEEPSPPISVTPSAEGGTYTIGAEHQYSELGYYQTTIRYSIAGSSEGAVTSHVAVAPAALNLTGENINGSEGYPLGSMLVARLTTSDVILAGKDLHLLIDWGDGNQSLGSDVSITGGYGSFDVFADHTYVEDGSYEVKIVASDAFGMSATVKTVATISETAPGITLFGGDVTAGVETRQQIGMVWAPSGISSLAGMIDWGDGTSSPIEFFPIIGQSSTYQMWGSHRYDVEGYYNNVAVTLTEADGTCFVSYTSYRATHTVMMEAATGLSVGIGEAFDGAVAAFTDDNPRAAEGDFSATINWGDGSEGPGIIALSSRGGFVVRGTHTYKTTGYQALSVTLTYGSHTQYAYPVVSVGAAVITGGTIPLYTVIGQEFENIAIAHFTTTDPDATAADFFISGVGGAAAPLVMRIAGDGTAGFMVFATGSVGTPGVFPYSFTLMDSFGATATFTGAIEAASPRISIKGRQLIHSGSLEIGSDVVASFTVSGATLPANSFSVSIDWGDGGTASGVISWNGSEYEITASSGHSYNSAGCYPVQVVISGPGGASASTGSLAVMGTSSSLQPRGDTYYVRHGQSLQVTGTMGTLANDRGATGTTLAAVLLSSPSGGALSGWDSTSGAFTFTPDASFADHTSFTYQVSDGFGQSEPVTVDIFVLNEAPVGAIDQYNVLHDRSLTIDADDGLLANDFDRDGDVMTIGGTGIRTTDHGGAVMLSSDGSFVYTPPAHFAGVDSFTYGISDGVNTFDSIAVMIEVRNNSPLSPDLNLRTLHGTALSGDLFAAAFDPDSGDALVAAIYNTANHGSLNVDSSGAFTYTPTAGFTGIDGFDFTLSDGVVSSAPIHVTIDVWDAIPYGRPQTNSWHRTPFANSFSGAIEMSDPDAADRSALRAILVSPDGAPTSSAEMTLNSDGTFVYCPAEGFAGTAIFYFVIDDGATHSDPMTLTFQVKDQSPVVTTLSVTTRAGVAYSGALAANVVDPDNDSLMFSTTESGDNSITVSANGTFTFTPETSGGQDFTGVKTFQYTVTDGVLSSTGTVTIYVTSDSLQAMDDLKVLGTRNTGAVSMDVLSNDLWQDGDRLQIHFNTISAGWTVSPQASTVSGAIKGSSTAIFTFMPGTDASLPGSFTYTLTNSAGESSQATVYLVWDAGYVAAIADTFTGPSGQLLTGVNVTGNDIAPVGSGAFVKSIMIGGQSHSLADLPLRLDHGMLNSMAADGTFSYTPDLNFAGADEFAYELSNENGVLTSRATVYLHITQAAPVAHNAILTTDKSQAVTLDVDSLVDGGADNISQIQIINGGHIGVADAAETNSVRYLPNGTFTGTDWFSYRVIGPTGLASNIAVVQVTVTGSGMVTGTLSVENGNFTTSVNTAYTINVLDYVTQLPGGVSPTNLTLRIMRPPEHGTVALSGLNSHNLIYVPPQGFFTVAGSAAETIEYELSDGQGHTATAMVSFTVLRQNASPVAPHLDITVEEYGTTSSDNAACCLIGGNTVMDDEWANPAAGTLLAPFTARNIVIENQPSYGTVTPKQNDNGTWYFKYTSSFSHEVAAADSFTYLVFDGDRAFGVGTATVTITAQPAPNCSPEAKPDRILLVLSPNQASATVNLQSVFTDVDDDPNALHIVEVTTPDAPFTANAHDWNVTVSGSSGTEFREFSVDVTVADGHGNTTQKRVDVWCFGDYHNEYPDAPGTYDFADKTSWAGTSYNVVFSGDIIVSQHGIASFTIGSGGTITINAAAPEIENIGISVTAHAAGMTFTAAWSVSGDRSLGFSVNHGDIGAMSFAGDLSVGTNGNISGSSITADGDLNVGAAGGVEATCHAGGMLSVSSGKGLAFSMTAQAIYGINAQGVISGAIRSSSEIGPVNGYALTNVITAGGDIEKIIAAKGITSSISAGGDIYQIIAGTTMFNTVVADGAIFWIQTGGDTSTTITAGLDIGSVRIGSTTIQASLLDGSSIESIEGSIGSVLAYGGYIGSLIGEGVAISAPNGEIEDVSAGWDVHATITAGAGDLGKVVSAHGTIHGEICAFGRLGSVTAGRDIEGTLTAGSIGTITAIGDITSPITSEGDIDDVETVAGSVLSPHISAGGNIGVEDVDNWPPKGVVAGADIASAIYSEGTIFNIIAGRDIQGSIEAAGENAIDEVRAFRDIMASITAGSLAYILAAGRDLMGHVTVQNDISSIEVGRTLSGDVLALNGSIREILVGSDWPADTIGGRIGNSTIRAKQGIGTVHVKVTRGRTGGVNGSILAEQGTINAIISGAGIDAVIHAGSGIESIRAGEAIGVLPGAGSIFGSILSNSGDIGSVITSNGFIDAAIEAILGDIGVVDAGLSIGSDRIIAGGDIGNIHAHCGGIGGDIAAGGSIQVIMAEGGGISGSITAGGGIEEIAAAGDIAGPINAQGNIGTVTAEGDIEGAVTSAGGSLGSVYAAGNLGGPLFAFGDIGTIVAGRSIGEEGGGGVTAVTGSIGYVVAGMNGGGSISGDITAGQNIYVVLARGNLPLEQYVPSSGYGLLDGMCRPNDGMRRPNQVTNLVNDLNYAIQQAEQSSNWQLVLPSWDSLIQPTDGQSGHIKGSINAGGNIDRVVAYGEIGRTIKAGGAIGRVWAGGDASSILAGAAASEALQVTVWRNFEGMILSPGPIDICVGGKTNGQLIGGSMTVIGWDSIDLARVQSTGDVELNTNADLRTGSMEVAGTVKESVRGIRSGSINRAGATGAVYGGAQQLSVEAETCRTFVIGKVDALTIKTFGWLRDTIESGVTGGVTLYTMDDVSNASITCNGDACILSWGNISNLQVDVKGTLSLAALKDITGLNVGGSGSQPTEVSVEAQSVRGGSISGGLVTVDASAGTSNGDVDISIIGQSDIAVHAAGSVRRSIISRSGMIDVYAGGDVLGELNAQKLVTVSTWGHVGGTVTASGGSVTIETYKGLSNGVAISALGDIHLISWSSVQSPLTSSSGDVAVFCAGDVGGSISAGRSVVVQASGTISASVGAGTLTGVSPEMAVATLMSAADGNGSGGVVGGVESAGNVAISTTGNVSGRITSRQGGVMVESTGIVSSSVSAKNDIQVYAKSIGGGSSATFTSQIGGVAVVTQQNAKFTINAKTRASVQAGTVADVIIDMPEAAPGASVDIVGARGVSQATVNAPNAIVSIFSGQADSGSPVVSLQLNIGGNNDATSSNLPASVNVFSYGDISGVARAKGDATVETWGGLSDLTVSTFNMGSTLNLFAAGNMDNVHVMAGDQLVAMGQGMAQNCGFMAGNHPGAIGAGGGATVYTTAGIADIVVMATGTADVSTDGSLSGASVYAANVNASARGDVEIDAMANDINIAALNEGSSVTGNIVANHAANVFAGGDMAADVQAGGSQTVELGPEPVLASVAAIGNVTGLVQTFIYGVSVSAGGSFSGTINAAGSAMLVASSVSGRVEAGAEGDATVFSSHGVSQAVSAGRDVEVHALDNISGAITAGRNATVFTTQAITDSADISAGGGTPGDAVVTAGGSIQADVTATGNVTISAGDAVTGAMNAGGNVIMDTVMNIAGSVIAGGNVSISAHEKIEGSIHAGGNAEVFGLQDITAPITAVAGSANVVAVGNLSGAVSAGNSITVYTWGNITGAIHAGENVTLTAWGDLSDGCDINAGSDVQGTVTGSCQGSIVADGNVAMDVYNTANLEITAGGDVTVSSFGNFLLTVNNANNVAVAGQHDLTTSFLHAAGDISIMAVGLLYATNVTSTGGDIVITSLSTANVLASTGTAGGDISMIVFADATVTLDAHGKVEFQSWSDEAANAWIDGDGGVNVLSKGWLFGSINSAGGDADIVCQGATLTTSSVHGALHLISMDMAHIMSGDAGSAEIDAGGTLSSNNFYAAESLRLYAHDAIIGNYSAGTDLDAQSDTFVHASLTTGRDLAVRSYGDIDATGSNTMTAGRYLLSLWARGDITGVFTAGTAMLNPASAGHGFIQAYGDINATFTAGTSEGDANDSAFGNITGMSAWGSINATVDTSGAVGFVLAGGSIALTIPAGQTPVITPPIAHDPDVFYDVYPPNPADAFAAVRAQLVDGARAAKGILDQVQQEVAQAALLLSQMIAEATKEAEEFANQPNNAAEAVAQSRQNILDVFAQQAADDKRQHLDLLQRADEALAGFNGAINGIRTQMQVDNTRYLHDIELEVAAVNQRMADNQGDWGNLIAAKAMELTQVTAQLQRSFAERPDQWKRIALARATQFRDMVVNVVSTVLTLFPPTAPLGMATGMGYALITGDYMGAVSQGVGALPFVVRGLQAVGRSAALAKLLCVAGRATVAAVCVYQASQQFEAGNYLGVALTLVDAFAVYGGIACFTGDTQVVVGIDPEHPGCYLTRSISEIRPGDLVLSREASNPDCPLEMRAVTSVSVRVVHSLCVLCLQDEQGHQETLQTTDQHPFYVPGQGWTAASGLAVGQQVLMAEGGERVVVQAETRFAPAGMVVYHREAAAALLGG